MYIERAFRFVVHLGFVVLLTVITQVGGVTYLLALLTRQLMKAKLAHKWQGRVLFVVGFVVYYVVVSFVLVPPLAKLAGRVPLPCDSSPEAELRPATWYTCACNRHYVVPEMLELLTDKARSVRQNYPDASIGYLDANFPFMDGFPLIPHLSHNDGRKVDLAFFYTDVSTQKPTHKVPSFIGYGVHEDARQNEDNTAKFCTDKGYINYDLIRHIVPQGKKEELLFNAERTAWLLRQLLTDERTGKVFLEPHLRDRLGVGKYPKLRFHGCHAVRHDDHIHVQL